MFGFLKFCILLVGAIAFNTFAQQGKSLQLKAGLWEGIAESDFSYKLLEINANGQHRILNLNITSAFKKVKFTPFTDSNIECAISECIINITNQNNPDENKRLLISLYLDTSFKVIEISTNQEGEPIFTQTYQLDKQHGQSTARQFIRQYKKRMKSLSLIDKDSYYGFWLGVLNVNGKPELLSFEAHPDNTSQFTRFANGHSFTNKISFTPDNVTKVGNILNIDIKTDKAMFANKLLILQSKIYT